MAEREVSALLVEVSRQEQVSTIVPASQLSDLVEAARFHRIAPLVHSSLRDSSPELAQVFEGDRMRAIAGHLMACGALRQLDAALDDLAWVTFKGPVFSEHAHPVPGLRSYNDVDVLVAPSSLRQVTHRLHAAGWRVADYADMLRNEAVPGEMHWVSPGGVLVDLHWSMINMASRRRLFEVSTGSLLERRVRTTLGGHPAWTLDPVDTLLHGCLHAALSGAHKLLYLIDVDGLRASGVSWDSLGVRAQEWRAQAQVALVLRRAQRVLGTSLPSDLSARLGVSRPLEAVMQATDRVAPVSGVRHNAGLAKFMARAVRASGPQTAGAIARNSGLWARERLRPSAEPAGGRSAADAEALEVYLSGVERAAALS